MFTQLGHGMSGHRSTLLGMSSALKTALGTPYTVIGDSMTYGDWRCKAYVYWLNLALSGRLLLPKTTDRGTASVAGGNCGVSGQTTAQIAARASTFNTHNGVYIILMGENDNDSVSAGDQQANFVSIFSELSAAEKIYVLPFAETKTVDQNATIATRNATNLAWLQSVAGVTYANVEVLPSSVWDGISLHDGAGGAGPDSYDGIHLTNEGAKKIGYNIYNSISGDLAVGDAYDHVSAYMNLFPDDFSGTSGSTGTGTSGDVADNFALTGSGLGTLSVVASKGTLNGNDSQIIAVSGTSGTGTIEIKLRRSSISHSYAIDDGFLCVGDLKITATDGSSVPQGLLALGISPTGGRHIFCSQYSPTNEGGLPFVIEGTFMGVAETNAGSGASLTTDIVFRIENSATVDIRFEVANLHIFNMTDEGI